MRLRLAVPMVGLLLLGLLHFAGLTKRLGHLEVDLLFTLRGVRPPDQRVVIVGIDEPSLRQLGAWPFPRQLHAQLLSQLRQARAVGFDLLFTESTTDDPNFNRAMTAGPPVVLALTEERDGQWLQPAPSLAGFHSGGNITTLLTDDGLVRRVELQPPPPLPAFAVALLAAGGFPLPSPLPAQAQWINFYGPEETFLYCSYADVLSGRPAPEFFRDRLVLVGARAVGLGDSHVTPFTSRLATPGVEIQATIVSNLLNHSFLRPQPAVYWLLSALICLVTATFWPACGEKTNLLINGLLTTLALGLSLLCFASDIIIYGSIPVLLLVLCYLVHLVLQLLRAARRVLEAARRLDRQIDTGLELVAATIPSQYLQAPTEHTFAAPAIQDHLDRLHAMAHALSMQHHFLDNLLKEELPPLILWEESGRPVFANTAFRWFWREYTQETEQLPSQRRFLKTIIPPPPADGEVAPNPSRTERPIDVQVLGPNGRRSYQASLRPLLVPDAGFSGQLAILQDVTDLKELERVKDEVVSIVSHELRLPLTAILGYGEMLAEDLPSQQQFFADEICRQTRRLQQLIEDFLDIARLESGRTQVRRFPFPLGRMVDDAIMAVRPKAQAKTIRLVAHQPSRTTPFSGDESLLLQATINLIDNAVKFSSPATEVTLTLEEYPEHFEIRVADQGPGIAPAERQRIFEKFQRGSGPDLAEGFGLGLHLVKQVVERHQGTVAALDAIQGALFQILLPKTGPSASNTG